MVIASPKFENRNAEIHFNLTYLRFSDQDPVSRVRADGLSYRVVHRFQLHDTYWHLWCSVHDAWVLVPLWPYLPIRNRRGAFVLLRPDEIPVCQHCIADQLAAA